MTIKYASIVPLIGGQTLGMDAAFNSKPDYLLSYTDFQANDSQLLNYYKNDIPYYLVDKERPNIHKVDVVSSTCPCAGLSSLSPTSSGDSTTNDWMIKSAEYVLEHVQPTVFWGENAPRLASKMGEPIVNQLRGLAKKYGYVFSIYKTKSILHGLSQVRDRTFYFFWKGNHVPMFNYYKRDYVRIEDQIRSSATNEPDPMFEQVNNKQKPSDNPYYQFVLEEMHGGISHPEFFKLIEKTTNPLHYIEEKGVSYKEVALWMADRGHEKLAEKCNYMFDKLSAGGNIMRKMTEIGKDHIGAFVGHFPHSLCHPDEDRYINTREALDIMKMPKDFILQGGVKNLNMICQNVPVTTAMDMAENVKKFLGNETLLFEADFVIQDNKTRSIHVESDPNTLENFL